MTLRSLVFMCLLIVLLKATSEAQSITFNRVDSLLELAKQSQETDLTFAKKLSSEAYRLSRKADYIKGVANAAMRLGSVMNRLSQNDSAAYYLRIAIHFRTDLKNYRGASNACSEMAIVMAETGAQDSAIYFALDAQRFAEKSGDLETICQAKIDRARLLLSYGNQAEAKVLFDEALMVAVENDFIMQRIHALDGLSFYHITRSEDQQAIPILLELNQIFQKENLPFESAQNYSNLCLAFQRIGEYQQALQFGDSALSLFESFGATKEVGSVLANNALIYSALGEHLNAISKAKEAIKYFVELKDLNLELEARVVLSEVFMAANMPDSAMKQQMQIGMLRDSIFSQDKIKSISEMQTKYETEKKDQEILFLDEQNKARTSQRNFLVAALGALLIALLFLGVIYYNRLRLNRKNQELAQERISGLIKEQEAKTYNALLEGQEEERKRIGTELHDRLGSLLSTTKLMFNSLEDKIAAVSDQQTQNFDKLNLMLDEAVTEVRRVSHDLHSGVVAGFGLVTAVQQQLDNIDQNSEIECKLNAFGMNERLPNAIELNVYRMIQEVLNNILKHAKATKISVQITRAETELNVMIEDNGVGFDVKSLEGKSGIGLKNLVMRAEKLGGTYHIDSQIGRGATSIIEIPLNNEHD